MGVHLPCALAQLWSTGSATADAIASLSETPGEDVVDACGETGHEFGVIRTAYPMRKLQLGLRLTC